MMAASFRNLVLMASFFPALHTFTATSIGSTNCCFHTARLTVPNCPLPIYFTILIEREREREREVDIMDLVKTSVSLTVSGLQGFLCISSGQKCCRGCLDLTVASSRWRLTRKTSSSLCSQLDFSNNMCCTL